MKRWTKWKMPDRPGWYWWRESEGHEAIPIKAVATGRPVVEQMVGTIIGPFPSFGEWQGPIEPEEWP